VVEWATGSSSMYNLLQELGSLNNVYCLEYPKHILQLLHSSFPTYFVDELSGSKSDNSPKCQVQAVNLHIEHWRLKKERQAAILARFSTKNNPILEQHNDQPNDDEHKSDDTGPADGLLEELSDASGRLSSISLIRQGKDLPSPSNWETCTT
jgi:hypothetical protein